MNSKIQIHKPIRRILALTWVCLLTLSGCGSNEEGPERVIVFGTITYDGIPVPQGEIWFVPAPGTQAPQAGAVIQEGQYRVENKGGVPSGTFQVKITGERPLATPRPVREGDPVTPATEQFLPPRYNDSTDLVVTIDSASGTVEQNFDLQP